ncbi:glycosyltransferase family 2 protein [uncultured Prevotella sp.]|uniref:glycosyltransferase family 2 protein n=1 Tax=uncultured Prevotella sp. TaxID=159272 RepID=UPI0027E32D7B|nr:glycosyltransferase family 2 protein [uncultured Prevotella sp.]
MPKVSVIIPVYGVEKYIERCARSLFEQTLDDIEYLFIDDCTPDKSVEILKRVMEEYPHRKSQVVIHRMEQNSGQAKVREWGMRNARGEYVIHCDSDDWVDVHMYEEMYNKAIEEDADVVISGFEITNGFSVISVHITHYKSFNELCKGILTGNISGALWNKLIRRSLLDYIKYPNGNMGEDMTIILQCLFFAKSISTVEKPLYSYYVNDNSISNTISENGIVNRFLESQKNANLLIDFFKSNGIFEIYERDIDVLLYNKKCALKPLLKKDKYYKMWKEAYKEVNRKIFFNSGIPLKNRIGYLFDYLHLI